MVLLFWVCRAGVQPLVYFLRNAYACMQCEPHRADVGYVRTL